MISPYHCNKEREYDVLDAAKKTRYVTHNKHYGRKHFPPNIFRKDKARGSGTCTKIRMLQKYNHTMNVI